MRYAKPPLSFDEQLDLLEWRGLRIVDRDQARQDLSTIGYYRLSGYWYQWRRRLPGHKELIDSPEDAFEGDHSIEEAIALYSFDRRFRLLLLDAIERIEVGIRVYVAHVAARPDALSYLDQDNLGDQCNKRRSATSPTNFEWFVSRNADLLAASSEQFATPIKRKYDSQPPIWAAVELWDFGILSHFYQIMRLDDQMDVARHFGVPTYIMLGSWLKSLAHLRNICAHHSRLYRRTLVVKPGKRDMRGLDDLSHVYHLPAQRQDKLYPTLCIMVHLMQTVAPGSQWSQALRTLLLEFPKIPGSSLSDYGFPDNWTDELLGRKPAELPGV